MDVIALIDGREAIPIRAIPSVTGWLMCPISLAMSLANADLAKKLKGVTAYHLFSNSGPAKTLPKEWDAIVIDLQALYSKLGGDEKIEQENLAIWRCNSIPLLPAGVFVWKDDFEHAFTRFYGSESHFRLEERKGDGS